MSPRGVIQSCSHCAASSQTAWRAGQRATDARQHALQLEDQLDRARCEIYELEKELTQLRAPATEPDPRCLLALSILNQRTRTFDPTNSDVIALERALQGLDVGSLAAGEPR